MYPFFLVCTEHVTDIGFWNKAPFQSTTFSYFPPHTKTSFRLLGTTFGIINEVFFFLQNATRVRNGLYMYINRLTT